MRLKCTLGRTDDRVRVGFVDLLRTRTVEVSFVMQEYYCKPAKEDIFFFQAEDGIRDRTGTGVQTCALPICRDPRPARCPCVGPGRCARNKPSCRFRG